jgi:hypothetical protein
LQRAFADLRTNGVDRALGHEMNRPQYLAGAPIPQDLRVPSRLLHPRARVVNDLNLGVVVRKSHCQVASLPGSVDLATISTFSSTSRKQQSCF